ncbi:MAG: protein kinase [Polyangiaceae bacterium]|nr:protein kinase [Polyangiaceae bacterium]
MSTTALEPGARYAGYRVVKLLGRGGMGVVYEAARDDGGAKVALKILHAHLHSNTNVVKRFEREAAFVRRLSGEHVVPLVDFGVGDDGSLFMALELVLGRPLDVALAADGPPPIAEVVRLSIEIARGLLAAHDKGVVHRDLKPANVMLEERPGAPPRARVCDFGLGKALGDEGFATKLTDKSMVFGTPEYMAPEQVTGDAIDVRTDVYSLGCVMYELLTGRPPFVGKTSMATLTMHLSDDVVPPSERAPHRRVPPALDAVVLRALSREPGARYQTVGELARALADVSTAPTASIDPLGMTQASDAGEPTRSRPVVVSVRPQTATGTRPRPVTSRTPPPSPRARWAPWAVTVALAVAVGASVGWFFTR